MVFFNRQTNLHSLWDSGLLNRLPPERELFPAAGVRLAAVLNATLL